MCEISEVRGVRRLIVMYKTAGAKTDNHFKHSENQYIKQRTTFLTKNNSKNWKNNFYALYICSTQNKKPPNLKTTKPKKQRVPQPFSPTTSITYIFWSASIEHDLASLRLVFRPPEHLLLFSFFLCVFCAMRCGATDPFRCITGCNVIPFGFALWFVAPTPVLLSSRFYVLQTQTTALLPLAA